MCPCTSNPASPAAKMRKRHTVYIHPYSTTHFPAKLRAIVPPLPLSRRCEEALCADAAINNGQLSALFGVQCTPFAAASLQSRESELSRTFRSLLCKANNNGLLIASVVSLPRNDGVGTRRRRVGKLATTERKRSLAMTGLRHRGRAPRKAGRVRTARSEGSESLLSRPE